jgi:endoglycosylceramidase
MKITSMSSAVLALLGHVSTKKMHIDTVTRTLRDEHERQVTLHGMNVVYKVDPYIPVTDKFDSQLSMSSEDIEYLSLLGFNMVRLGVIWEAVEKKEGVYDEAYLK